MKQGQLIAELSFTNKKYIIKYIKENLEVKTWFNLYRRAKFFDLEIGCMMPYINEINICEYRASLERLGYTFIKD